MKKEIVTLLEERIENAQLELNSGKALEMKAYWTGTLTELTGILRIINHLN